MAKTRRKRTNYQLTVVMSADVVGYSVHMHRDEEGTHRRLTGLLDDIVEPTIAEYRGHIVKRNGDGFLAKFRSAIEAVQAAMNLQSRLRDETISEPEEQRLIFRVGINLGDVIFYKGEIFGDEVNIAVRLEEIAKPGGVCVSSAVYDKIRDKGEIEVVDRGEVALKNIARPVRAYDVVTHEARAALDLGTDHHLQSAESREVRTPRVFHFLSQAGALAWPWVKFATIALAGVGVFVADSYVLMAIGLIAQYGVGVMTPLGWALLPLVCMACIALTGGYAYLFADRHRRSQFTSHFLRLWRHSSPVLSVAVVAALVLGGFQYSDRPTTLLGVLIGLGFALKWSGSGLLPNLQKVLSAIVNTCLITLICATAVVLYTAASWDLLPSISLASVAFAVGFVGLFVLGIVVMLEILWVLALSVAGGFDVKRASTVLVAAFGALNLIAGIGDAMGKGDRIGNCDLSGIDEIVFVATGWQQDTKAASICSWPKKEPPGQ